MNSKFILIAIAVLVFFVPFLILSVLFAPDPSQRLLRQFEHGIPLPKPVFALAKPGAEMPLDLEKYGRYADAGTPKFSFQPTDLPGIQKAVPAGVYPNQKAIFTDPAFRAKRDSGAFSAGYWKLLDSGDLETAFYVWTQAPEPEGVKLFFTAIILERAGHIVPAMHAYQSLITFYPKSVVFSKDGSFVWYPAEAAMASLRRLCNTYLDLGLEYKGGAVVIQNGGDPKTSDDVFTVTPGRFVKRESSVFADLAKKFRSLKVVERRGNGKVQLLKDGNGDWKMRVDGKSYFIRSVAYSPTRIGTGPKSDPDFSCRWMFEDLDKNGKIDTAYDAWIDANSNGVQDPDEPAVGDFEILRRMGANTIKMFHIPTQDDRYTRETINVPLLRELHAKYGIRVVLGDFIGAYTIGSGADWETGTDYRDPAQRERMKSIIRDRVKDLKDEPWILFWLLGNENNMNPVELGVNATRTNAGAYPEDYAKFLQEVATMIHEIDPNHPVAVGNLEVNLLDVYAKHAPALDIVGINSYRGAAGFGSLWQSAKRLFDRPVFITEFGCDAYHEGQGVNEDEQKAYIEGNVRDMVLNQAGGPGQGNAIGGSVFEYLDEWWKDTHSGDPEDSHQTKFAGNMPFPDNHNHEEWFGILGQGSGKNSPFERNARKAYHYLCEVWGPDAV